MKIAILCAFTIKCANTFALDLLLRHDSTYIGFCSKNNLEMALSLIKNTKNTMDFIIKYQDEPERIYEILEIDGQIILDKKNGIRIRGNKKDNNISFIYQINNYTYISTYIFKEDEIDFFMEKLIIDPDLQVSLNNHLISSFKEMDSYACHLTRKEGEKQ